MEMKMKMKNRHSKHGHGWKLGSPAAMSLKFYLCVFCFTFVPLGLLRSLGGTASANSASQVGQVGRRLPQDGSNIPRDPNNRYGPKLWRAQISIAKGRDDGPGKDRLMRMIEQVRSVEFKALKPVPEPVVAPKVTVVPEPNETPPDTTIAEPAEEVERQIETDLPYKPVSSRTLQMLRDLSQHPEKLDNPFELGEILFISGNFKDAAIFYREALNRRSPDDAGSARDRAWILFQIGNCLRKSDPPAAAKMYGQLTTEYPNCAWAALAQAQRKLMDWYQKDEPHKLIAENGASRK
jgi:tetratricopeptide (TPR) repeat protein